MNSTSAAVRLSAGTITVIATASVGALVMALWPWMVGNRTPGDAVASSALTMVLLPVMMVVVLVQLADGAMDPKSLALLGVVSAVIAAIRPLGSGVGGVETVFFLLILGGRAFGPGFGFALGGISMVASALLTGGVGPWLGMQMVCAAWIGFGAGLLPRRVRGKAELALLAAYGVLASYLFGALMNLWFWPSLAGTGATASGIGFVPGAPALENLRHFLTFTLVTSTATWDTVRAVTCAACLVVLGRPILNLLRRAGVKAAFGDVPTAPAEEGQSRVAPSAAGAGDAEGVGGGSVAAISSAGWHLGKGSITNVAS
jgi:energy-coupling factor transport system substrate-specific component